MSKVKVMSEGDTWCKKDMNREQGDHAKYDDIEECVIDLAKSRVLEHDTEYYCSDQSCNEYREAWRDVRLTDARQDATCNNENEG